MKNTPSTNAGTEYREIEFVVPFANVQIVVFDHEEESFASDRSQWISKHGMKIECRGPFNVPACHVSCMSGQAVISRVVIPARVGQCLACSPQMKQSNIRDM